jgi:hypothetical protein
VAGIASLVVAACGTTVPMAAQTSSGPQGDVGLGTSGQQTPPTQDGVTAPVGPGTSTGAGNAPGQPTSSGSSAPAVNRPSDPSGPTAIGAQPQTGPINLGFISVNNDAASSAGVNDGRTFTPRQAFEALVRAYNAGGGIAGRRIVPTYIELKSSSNNYPQALEAACTRFVQDSHDQAVLGVLGSGRRP